MKIKFKIIAVMLALCAATLSTPLTALASMPPNYNFTSGSDFRYALGRPTIHTGNVTPNPLTQNIRRDRHAAHLPVSYGVFSGIFDTPLANPSFARQLAQPSQPFQLQDPNSLTQFDTLQMGANAPNTIDWQHPNPINMFNVGEGGEPFRQSTGTIHGQSVLGPLDNSGFLPSTSIGN